MARPYADDDEFASGAVATTELRRRIDETRKEDAALRESRDIDPPSMPQVERELTLVVGIMSGVEQAVARLIVKIEPVCGQAPPLMEAKRSREEKEWPVTAQIAVRLREVYDRLNEIETQVSIAAARVEL